MRCVFRCTRRTHHGGRRANTPWRVSPFQENIFTATTANLRRHGCCKCASWISLPASPCELLAQSGHLGLFGGCVQTASGEQHCGALEWSSLPGACPPSRAVLRCASLCCVACVTSRTHHGCPCAVHTEQNSTQLHTAVQVVLMVRSAAAWAHLRTARVAGLLGCVVSALASIACIRLIVILKRLETDPLNTHATVVTRSTYIAVAAAVVAACCILCVSEASAALQALTHDTILVNATHITLHCGFARDYTVLALSAVLCVIGWICSSLGAHWWHAVPEQLLRVPPHIITQEDMKLDRPRVRRRSSSEFLRHASNAFQEMADVVAIVVLPPGSVASAGGAGGGRLPAPSLMEAEMPPLSLSARSKAPIHVEQGGVQPHSPSTGTHPGTGWGGGVAPFSPQTWSP